LDGALVISVGREIGDLISGAQHYRDGHDVGLLCGHTRLADAPPDRVPLRGSGQRVVLADVRGEDVQARAVGRRVDLEQQVLQLPERAWPSGGPRQLPRTPGPAAPYVATHRTIITARARIEGLNRANRPVR
jgi:hypothetical protein